MTINDIRRRVNNDKYHNRSAWGRGVTAYANDLLDTLEEAQKNGYYNADLTDTQVRDRTLLNGASDWDGYSWGGSSLIYDQDIAERLCTPTELKRTRNGERRPNAQEEWLDVQARALRQARDRIHCAVKAIVRGEASV